MLMDTMKKWVKLGLIGLLLAGGGYAAGWFAKPEQVKTVTVEKKVEVLVKDEAWAQQRIEEYKSTHKDEFTVHTHSTTTVSVPCPQPPLEPGDTCKPPCATDCSKCPKQVITTTTDTDEHHNVTDTHSGGATTNTTGTTHTTDTIHTDTQTTTTVTNHTDPLRNWQMGVRADLKLFDKKLALTPNYGLTIGHKLLGPTALSATLYTDKTLTASLSLSLKSWLVSADASTNLTNIAKPNFGGSLERRILGPLAIGVWGNSSGVLGARASFDIR